jgi:WGR domain
VARRTSVRSRGSTDFYSQSSAAVATRRGRCSGWGFKRSRRRFPLAFVGEARHLVAVLDFRITLEARNPARGCLRHYRVEAGTDLFGVWVVEISYGRIGTVGRSRSFVVRDEAQARRLAQSILKRRATAPRRIGVAYHILELIDPGGWVGSSGSVGTAEVRED